MPFVFNSNNENKARGSAGKLQQITSGQYYSPKPPATQPSAHHFSAKKHKKNGHHGLLLVPLHGMRMLSIARVTALLEGLRLQR